MFARVGKAGITEMPTAFLPMSFGLWLAVAEPVYARKIKQA